MTALDQDRLAGGVGVVIADQLVAATGVADGAVVVGGSDHPGAGSDGHGEHNEREPPEDGLLAIGRGPAPGTGGKRVLEHVQQAPLTRPVRECGGLVSRGGGIHTPYARAIRSSAAPIAFVAWAAKRRSMP